MPGQILGERYEIEQQLGKKSGRWTLLARDLLTETPVILKLLSIDQELQEHDLRLFEREIEVLKTIEHPAIPRYLDYFEIALPKQGKAMVLIETYVKGKSLQQALQAGQRLTEPAAIDVAKAVLQILADLHSRQPPIVHRDIKPSNILRCDDPTSPVCLLDFGSVKSLQVADRTSFMLVGTEGYSPPEQLGGRAIKASDLYSLGVTLVAAMTGAEAAQLPRRRGMQIDIEQVLTPSPAFCQWLKQMTATDLTERFTAAETALRSLNQVHTS
jgi:serine/threonine protein kinase